MAVIGSTDFQVCPLAWLRACEPSERSDASGQSHGVPIGNRRYSRLEQINQEVANLTGRPLPGSAAEEMEAENRVPFRQAKGTEMNRLFTLCANPISEWQNLR